MVNQEASLIVVGSGIKFISHLTIEAKAYIEQSNKVLYLLNEPAMKSWIECANANTESLDPIYTAYPFRSQSYTAITNHILNNVRQNQHVCVALYGHPTFFATPALNAVIQAKQEGYYAKILPGISSEACLFADLLIDPGSNGCLSLEATDLLVYQRKIDVSCHVILWQVSVIGMLGHIEFYDNQRGLDLLYSYLIKYYSSSHELTLYSASQYPGFEPTIKRFRLDQIKEINFPRVATLYIPPSTQKKIHKKSLTKLKMI